MAYMAEMPEAGPRKAGQVPVSRLSPRRPLPQRGQTHGRRLCAELRPMVAGRTGSLLQGPAGYLGPIGLEACPQPRASRGRFRHPRPRPSKAAPTHGRRSQQGGVPLRNVTPGRDFNGHVSPTFATSTKASCDSSAGKPLQVGKAVEIGHIFKLGYKYTKSMGATVLNRDGKEVTPIMGSYGIGIERILTAAIESSAAANDGESLRPPPGHRSLPGRRHHHQHR